MPEFPDKRSVTGRIGALTVIGELHPWADKTFAARYLAFRVFGYSDLQDLRSLYSLRWSVVRFPFAKRMAVIFETIFTGDWEQYLHLLAANAHRGIDLHSFGAVGYPGAGNEELFIRYIFEHHRPATHIYAANPLFSVIDSRLAIRAFAGEETTKAAALLAPYVCNDKWFGAVFPIRLGHRGAVSDAVELWNASGNSPFTVPDVHHGRAVIFQNEGVDLLLIGVMYSSPHKKQALAIDRLLDQLLADDRWQKLRTALLHCEAPAATEADLRAALLAHTYGLKRRQQITWTDEPWRYSPAFIMEKVIQYAAQS
jgi:hypothetical protein